jgi:hypothetical protein
VESENDGTVVDDKDWTTSWMRDRGCWERFRRGISNAEMDDSSALDDVAEAVNNNSTSMIQWHGYSPPPTPSNGRWITSRVALSGSSSRSRTSMGPFRLATAAVDPVRNELGQRRCRDVRNSPKAKRPLPSARASWPTVTDNGLSSVGARRSCRLLLIAAVSEWD